MFPNHNASSREVSAGTQSKNLESGDEAEVMEEMLLTGLFCMAY